MTSLAVSAGNYCTSNPVDWARFEILLPPPRAVGVACSGSAVVFSVSSEAARGAPAPVKGEGPTSPIIGAGGEKVVSRIVLVEGERADDLTVGRVVNSQPCGVYSRAFHEPWGSTDPRITLG